MGKIQVAGIPPVGSVAPDFTLQSTSGKPVTLSSFRGKQNVLLAFFPFAFTSTCTAELCEFSTDYSQFTGADTVVLPISCDFVPALKAFKAKEQMTVDLLGDVRREVSRAYGVLLEEAYRVGEGHLTVAMMVAVGLAIGRHAFELRLRGVFELRFESRSEVFSGIQQAFKGDSARGWTVVEKHCDGDAGVEADEVRPSGID